jgi:spore maturation protein CgeB
MKVLIKRHRAHAGFWIYTGYASAWRELGYDVYLYDSLEQLKKLKDFYLMAIDSDLKNENIEILSNSTKTFLFVQPNHFPKPWGEHPNFISSCNQDIMNKINNLTNVKQWTFVDSDNEYYSKWNVTTIPLAFDDINYNFKPIKEYDFDICYVGGRANNGFDEKIEIINKTFSLFEKTNLKCGFFIDKNLSHDQEVNIILRSKLCLNIHDAYQKKLSLDTNERTFKSLGLNGTLISDNILQIKKVLPEASIILSNNLNELVDKSLELCNLDNKHLLDLKNKNIDYIKSVHTYKNRISQLMSSTNV